MTYRVFRKFEGAGGETFSPGQLLEDPAFPAENLKALLNQRYVVYHDPKTAPVKESEKKAAPKRRGRNA